MSGIPSVSPVVTMTVTALMKPAAPKAKPATPESAFQEAIEPLPETRSEAEQGDQQAIHKLAAILASAGTQTFKKVAASDGSIDLQV